MTQLQKPFNVTFSPNLSGLTVAGRNTSATRITVTNNDSRDIAEVRINVLRADLMPSATMSEAAIVKAGAGETIITDKWVQAKLSTDVAYTPINDWDSPIAFTLDAAEVRAFDVRLVIPDSIDIEGKISFSLLVSFLANAEPKVTSISVDNTPLVDIRKGRAPQTTLTATVIAEAGASLAVTWASTDENIFTVASDGTVTGVNEGRAIITAISSDPTIYNGVYLTILPPEVISITIDDKPLADIEEGDPLVLTATVVADTGADDSVTWASSDDNIATIASDGTVTTIIAGTVTFTATSSNPAIFDTAGLTITAIPVPVTTGIVAWYDADDASTIASSGTDVYQWRDKSGNGYHASPSASVNFPSTDTDTLNSKNVIKFNGVHMTMPVAVIPAGISEYTICAVWKAGNTNEALVHLGGTSTANTAVGIHTSSTNIMRQYWWSNDLDTTVASWDANSIMAIWDGTTRTTRIDGSDNTDTPTGKATATAYSALGGIPANGYMLTGYIAEIMIYHRALTPTEISENEIYLNTKWGV